MDHYHGVRDELAGPYRELRQRIPAVLGAYAALHTAAMADGVLSARTKELIALALAVSRQCDGCVAAHARGAARRGATADEVAEAVGVAVLLDGGPSTVWGARALAAFHEFADEGPPPA